jgi:hypothetical protein
LVRLFVLSQLVQVYQLVNMAAAHNSYSSF